MEQMNKHTVLKTNAHDSGIFRRHGLEEGSLQQTGDYLRWRPNASLW